MNAAYQAALTTYLQAFKALPDIGLPFQTKVHSTLALTDALYQTVLRPDQDPYPELISLLSRQTVVLEEMQRLVPQLDRARLDGVAEKDGVNRTKVLYEEAWTTFSDDTYANSVDMVKARLKANGYDESFFKGKRCFDGGCGIGRLSVAMAQMGAAEVVSVDIGTRSLAYFAERAKRLGLDAITTVEQDVTDLSRFADGSFDFVCSYGVLHHTPRPVEGLREHWRITRPGGQFWLYLYGAEGFFWESFDQLRDAFGKVDLALVKQILMDFGIRDGLVYYYLDNVFAPRVYFKASQVAGLLEPGKKLPWRYAKGGSALDDPQMCLNSAFGAQILGPEGEVRMIFDKQA